MHCGSCTPSPRDGDLSRGFCFNFRNCSRVARKSKKETNLKPKKMAASMKSSLKIKEKPSQNDLRRLMKEKQNSKRIESPLAKYNNLDQLFCVLCNCQVKNETLWLPHVNGKQHKQNLEYLKQQKAKEHESKASKATNQEHEFKKPSSAIKRKPTVDNTNTSVPPTPTKLMRISEDRELPGDFFDEPPSSTLSCLSSSESSSPEEQVTEFTNTSLQSVVGSNVKPSTDKSKTPSDIAPVVNKVEALPEGFFDDPIIDAKVRKVEYKDPAEEEWDKFQKEIAAVTNKSQVIMDEEEEESTTERQIMEIDEQIHNWARVEALQRRKDELVKHTDYSGENDGSQTVDVDEQEYEEFLDWRSKGSWR